MSSIPVYQNRRDSMRPITRKTILGIRLACIVLAMYWIFIFVGTHLPKAFISSGPELNDKVVHFTIYAGLGTFMCYVTNSPRVWMRFSIIFFIGLLYAGFDEYTQQFSEGRTADLMDFVADGLGLFTAIIVYASIRNLYYRFKAPQYREVVPMP